MQAAYSPLSRPAYSGRVNVGVCPVSPEWAISNGPDSDDAVVVTDHTALIGAVMSTVARTDESFETGLHLLEAGIPLSLLLDLAAAPDSQELYDNESPDLSWLSPRFRGQLAG